MSAQIPSEGTAKLVKDAIAAARNKIEELLKQEEHLRPLFLRIAFYDALTYDPVAKIGGPNGSIRNCEGLDEELKKAIRKLDSLKGTGETTLLPYISYADLYQLAGIVAVQRAEGPIVEFQHGRTDSSLPIPLSKIQVISEGQDAASVRSTFRHLGFNDKEIVALSAAYYYWMNYPSPGYSTFTTTQQRNLANLINLNNSYYQRLLKEIEIEKIEASSKTKATDVNENQSTIKIVGASTSSFRYWKCLISDASFRKYVELFAENKEEFSKEYAAAHQKLSELGFKHIPDPFFTEVEYHDIKHGLAFAVAMTILFGFMGFLYEVMRP